MLKLPPAGRALALFLVALAAAGCTDTPSATPGAETPAGAAAGPTAVEVRMVRDDSTGIELPRVTLAGRPAVEARVNARLDSLAASLRCEAVEGGPDPADMSYSARTAVTHAADDVLSVAIHAAYACGGPYPTNDANLSVTYDLTTGEAVPFEALFRDYDANRAAIAGVLQTTLAPIATGGELDSDCTELFSEEAMEAMTFQYALGAEGLLVQPDFPHVTAACAAEATIPYASMKPFAAEGGPLARVAAGAVTGR